MNYYRPKKLLISLFALFSPIILLYSKQKESDTTYNSTNKATLIGIGSSSLYDTYLSPLKYNGTSIHLLHERIKNNSWFNNKFALQQILNLEFAWADSPTKNTTEYSILLDFRWGGHYNLININNFRFSVGSLWNITGGVLYNERNSNNPASAKAYSNINISLLAFYNYRNITFRAQIDSPIFGIAFSPHYRQSYYEISLGNSVKVVNFASFHNQRALNGYFTADIPISRITLRIGYLGSFYQTKMQSIITHNYSNSIIIGLASESLNLSGNKLKSNKIFKSAYY